MEAPLHLNIADAPDDGRAFWARTSDGVRIRFAVWPSTQDFVLIYPGRTEYIEKYGRVISKLRARGFGVVILDWRNQGLSDRAAQTGHVGDYTEYQADIASVLSAPEIANMTTPPHLLSHSMGGLIALRSLKNGLDVKSAVFSAPMWGMGLDPMLRDLLKGLSSCATKIGMGKWKIWGAKRGSYIREADPENNSLTGNPQTALWIQSQLTEHPELALGGPSWAWLHASHREIKALKDFDVPNLPTLTILGSAEEVVDPKAVTERVLAPKNGQLMICEKAKHEVLMETPPIQKEVWAAMDDLWQVPSV